MSSNGPSVFRLVSHMLAAVFNSRSAFHREWQRYTTLANRADCVEGRWTGEWISEVSGHKGELKCVLVPVTSGKYRAFFHAGFSKLFRVGYVTDLQIEQTEERITLAGQEDLGTLAGGVYRCEGEIREAEFNCHYSCHYDQGLFRLKRVD